MSTTGADALDAYLSLLIVAMGGIAIAAIVMCKRAAALQQRASTTYTSLAPRTLGI